MHKIRKGDVAEVIKGRDAGKKGKILKVFPETKRALVEGLHLVKKHKRQTRQDQQGGIVSIESPISIANLLPFCKSCNRGVRVGFTILEDKTKFRFCKVCKEAI